LEGWVQGATVVRSTVNGLGRPGTPTVFIHGVGSRLDAWANVVPHLSTLGPLVRYDLRGHGLSPAPPGPWELDDFVADHLALLAELGISRSNVVGFSLGGLIAQAIAVRQPEVVDKLVIMGAVAGRTAAERDAVLERLALVEQEGPAGVAARSGTRWYTEEYAAANPEIVQRHLEEIAANDPAAYAAAYRVLATNDLVDELPAVRAATLVVTGADDVGSPPHMAEAMAERIPDARVVVIPDQRHSLLEECPEQVADLLRDFLAEPGADSLNGSHDGVAAGMAVRREVLGDPYVERAVAHQDAISAEFQSFITQYCWGEIWTDPRLRRRERSLLVLGMTAALGRMKEFEAHCRGALRNGVTPDELASVLKQIAVYCGVPAGVAAAGSLRAALRDEPQESYVG
jgi:pimeloyl-ACP methyl ester carboxylesterase/alkylhydroperoxidase/carboxymuconolactone decarboxylase family protein YurZ